MAGTCRIEHPLRDRGPNSGDCHRWDRRSASPGEAFWARSINDRLGLLKVHLPYHESDHVLNIDYNLLAGGTRLEHLELLRNDEGYLDALGARRIPDPTTAGDFCRRFDAERINTLQEIFNDTRVRIWRQQPEDFFREAVLDADGTMVETTGQCKEEMDINYKNQWGCHPLMLSLANTGEPLHVVNRPGQPPQSRAGGDDLRTRRSTCAGGLGSAGFVCAATRPGRDAVARNEEKRLLLRMEFTTFRRAFMAIPTQVVKAGRRIVFRLLAWNHWLPAFYSLLDQFRVPIRC